MHPRLIPLSETLSPNIPQSFVQVSIVEHGHMGNRHLCTCSSYHCSRACPLEPNQDETASSEHVCMCVCVFSKCRYLLQHVYSNCCKMSMQFAESASFGKTAFGATPMGDSVKKIADIIAKTMMPAVLTAHKVDQKHLNEAACIVCALVILWSLESTFTKRRSCPDCAPLLC